MLYRIKQFFWALTARLKNEDKELIDKYLSFEEQRIFYKLPVYDQVHSVKVAREIINNCYENAIYDIMLFKAGFLHDIGKIDGGLNVINTSILVILNKVMPEKLRKFQNIKAIDTYFNHPEKALIYLKDMEDDLKLLVLNHHNYEIKDNRNLKILQDADSKN